MAKRGRPTKYTEALADKICERVAEGESLNAICKEPEMPARLTIYRWFREYESFSNNYARAREDQADFYADEIIALADSATDPQKARLQIDTRKWVASKLKSKKYGDKVQQEITGVDGKDLNLWGSKPE